MNRPRIAVSLASAVASAVFAVAAPAFAADPRCAADLDSSGSVDAADLSAMLAAWGSSDAAADLDDSGVVSGADLAILLVAWAEAVDCTPVSWGTVLEQEPDPAVVTDAGLRKAIVATGLPWRVRDNSTSIEMRLVPAGTFMMGCSSSDLATCFGTELPVHQVSLTSSFYIGRHEVTQAEWTAVVGLNPSFHQGAGFPEAPNLPVESVSRSAFLGFMSKSGLRLPTEAEWEYAYRAGTTTAFHGFPGAPEGTSNDALVGEIAWYSGNNGEPFSPENRPKVVGQKAANGLGLHDMSGNVQERVSDFYLGNYYSSSPGVDPTGPASGEYSVARGGAYWESPFFQRASSRVGVIDGAFGQNFVGFRVARNP
jgi:formylglycine-generating enzyme required for sulfatase activity